ncbi:AAA family ATPase [Meiothermus sp. CFH 77666]|nr:AAA family ATPase [Meiothermus sp. CFH 77666]MBO1436082.1 AAA family ATPase [Meiothermus sp. CFH 77666]
MPFAPLTFPQRVPQPTWAVDRLFPLGHVSLVFAPPGVGKTRLASYLAVQVAREQGHFLGRAVRPGRVLILDADDPTGFGYQTWVNRFLNGYPDASRDKIELRAITGGLTPEDVDALADEICHGFTLIVLDTFASAFLGLDIMKAHHVQAALTGLAGLAKALDVSILLLDHVGKLQPGETVAGRGAYGSAAKGFAPRAVFALDRVPPKEVNGADVLRLTCTKMSYAPEPAPVGFSIALENLDTVARAYVVALPEASSLIDKAKVAMLQALKLAQGVPINRQHLLTIAVQKANCTERWAASALKELEADLGPRLAVQHLGGRGNPLGYTLLPDLMNSKLFDEVGTSSNEIPSETVKPLFDELIPGINNKVHSPLEPLATRNTSSNGENSVQDSEGFDEVPTSSNPPTSSNLEVEL